MSHLPDRRTRALDPIHPTAPRVGIFAQAARVRSTGPQAHQSPYMADEEREVRRLVRVAVLRFFALVGVLVADVHFWHVLFRWTAQ